MEATAEEFAAAADAGDVTAASNALRAITEAGANSPGAASAAVPARANLPRHGRSTRARMPDFHPSEGS